MPNKYDVLTGEIENTSAVATFDELQEWYNSTKEGRTLWKGGDLEKWTNGFIKFYQDYGFTPTAGNSLFVRSDITDSNRLFINQSTNQNIVNEYGTVPSVPTWNTGAVTGQLGQLNTSLNGGCKVAQQLITSSTDSATGEFTTATVGGTAVGTLTLSDILLGGALGMGLGVAFTEFFPDQATDFSNFMLAPLINAGLLEKAEYDTTRVGLMGVFKEHNDEQANKFILPYAPYEIVEKGLQYLLKIGAFNKGIIINSNKPNLGTGLSYSNINDDIYKSTMSYLSDYIWDLIPTNNDYDNLREHKDDIVSLLIGKLSTIFTGIKEDYLYEFRFAIRTNIHRSPTSSSSWNNSVAMAIYERSAANLSAYNVKRVSAMASNTVEPFNTDAYSFSGTGTYFSNDVKEYKIAINKFNEYEEFQNKLLSANPTTKEAPDGNTAFGNTLANLASVPNGSNQYFPYDKVGLWAQGRGISTDGTLNGADISIGTINTNYTGGTTVKGLQFTDYTPLIKDINDLTARLQEWKDKKGWKVDVPSYDEKGKPNGIREQWYLPIPTPSPSQKESGEYITPTLPYWETPVTPDSTPDLKKEIADKTKDLTDVLPENPEYNPKPTPPDDNTGTIEDSTSILGNNGQGLWSVYNPNLAQINEFGAWLWSNNIWEQIRQYFSDPMQGIIGLHKIYCKPTNGETKTIIAGYLDSGINSPIVTKQYERIDCGTMACAEYYGNALDYAPYTTVHLYLPFIGIVPLNVNEVMGTILHIFYDVDILTGACLATIEVKDSANINISLYQYNGICSVQIPLTSGNYGSVISSLVTTGAGIVATVASGGALAPVALGGAVSALNSGAEIKQSGTIGANVGAMARKKPYMVITRKIPHMPLNYNGLVGFPSNNRTYLSELSGFVRTKKVYVSSLIATQNEKNMIEEILSDGVYI